MARGHRRRRPIAPIRRRTLPGAPPGILVPDPSAPPPVVQVIGYGPEGYTESSPRAVGAAVREQLARWPVTWVNVDGLGDAALLIELGRVFGFHGLALEDVVHVHQRAKVEQYPSHLFIVARMPVPDGGGQTEQISMFLGERFLVTFQERPGGDCLDPVRVRIRTGVSPLRRAGADYLAYALLDAIVDHYFPLLERVGESLDELEPEDETRFDRSAVSRLHEIKRTLLMVRRAVWPLRDALAALAREPTPLVSEETRVYLRDCHDHTVQVIDLVETYRDIASGLHELYLSMVSNRTNEIMRVLTIIATVFIPLTFIAGVYGMNFSTSRSPWNMPELNWYWGYPAVMALMAAVAGGLLVYFARKGWLGGQGPQRGGGARGQRPDG